MSDKIQHINLDDEDFEDAPKALRDYAKKLKAENERLNGDLVTATKNLASRAVADVLADKGFKNPKRVERDLLAESIDPHDQKAVEEWLEANGDDYAKGEANTPASAPEDAEKAQQFEKLSVPGATSSNDSLDKWEAAQQEITPGMNGDQVAEVFARHGI